MAHNRISECYSRTELETGIPAGFVVCSLLLPPASPMAQVAANQDLYRLAREHAERQLSAARVAKRMFSVWN